MTTPPRAALVLGVAGLAPFVWGALTALMPVLARFTTDLVNARLAGVSLLVDYGVVILCFMSGALWGFASRRTDRTAFALSVVPALWVLLAVGDDPREALRALMLGFVGILVLDAYFWVRRYAPEWWIALRLGLTAVVVPCLALGLYHG
ncbi:DUF3429 domain-containing protein [Rhodobacteraceae bacterium WD3A24]|nr:DUF3429 domain-containing protein [Rhodobacteraceae bacterium WD3A24]